MSLLANIHDMNVDILCKRWWWKLHYPNEEEWIPLICCYPKSRGVKLGGLRVGPRTSVFWERVSKVGKIYRRSVNCLLGSGNTIRFWKEC